MLWTLLKLFADPRVIGAKAAMISALREVAAASPEAKPAVDAVIAKIEAYATAETMAAALAGGTVELVELFGTGRGPVEFHRGAHGG